MSKKKEKKIFLVCFVLCGYCFRFLEDQTMKCMSNIKFGDVCHVISRPGGSFEGGKSRRKIEVECPEEAFRLEMGSK